MSKLVNRLISIGFIGYFLCLVIERTLAVFLSFYSENDYGLVKGNGIATLYYFISAIFLFCGFICLFRQIVEMTIGLFKKENYEFDFKIVISGCMILLVSAMMSTGFMLPALQFVGYGFLIMSMVLVTVNLKLNKMPIYNSLISLIFLVLFSMTIPVCHLSINPELSISYYICTLAAVACVTPYFGIMLYKFFTESEIKFDFFPVIIMTVLSSLAVFFNFTSVSNFNWFVMIFVVLTIIVYLGFGIRIHISKRKKAVSK